MSEQPTVAFFPEPGAWGRTNNLVAVGNHLRERGIRHEEQVGEGWAEFIRVTPTATAP